MKLEKLNKFCLSPNQMKVSAIGGALITYTVCIDYTYAKSKDKTPTDEQKSTSEDE